MTALFVLVPTKRSRSSRLREKLRIGAFLPLGVEYEAAPSIDMQDRFIDHLLEDVLESRAVSLGGGVGGGFVAARHMSGTGADRAAFDNWVQRWPDLAEIEIGPLPDA
ncbi:uncharacterized protein YggL (DUF469 family) [Pelomonas aquatica]|uniref:Uncharacterized protein YggL (DUF469 family) n=2 Tax=Pelomonas aquatica TaxID=431058 RepID=A0ABU1ZFT7_9BURK|nr:uncharacterized protein YggL (DUF469 family) [Pelomonas aquatica]